MSMPKGSLHRGPWCCGLLVVVQDGAGVDVACVKCVICMCGQKGRTEGGAHMLRHLEARIATDVCVSKQGLQQEPRSRGLQAVPHMFIQHGGAKIEDEEL